MYKGVRQGSCKTPLRKGKRKGENEGNLKENKRRPNIEEKVIETGVEVEDVLIMQQIFKKCSSEAVACGENNTGVNIYN